MGRPGEIRDDVDRLEEVKDLIVEFLEGAPISDPATRQMWIGDAKEAFLEVLAAYDLLPSEQEGEPKRSADTLAFLQMARSRVKQVASELKALNTDVADALTSQLQEAFDAAEEAISSRAGGPPPGLAAGTFSTVEATGEDHYALRCSACGQVAAEFKLDVPSLSTTGQEAIMFAGVTKSTHFDMSNEKAIFGRLQDGDLKGLHQFLEGMVDGGLDAYCPVCDKVYCRDHYDLEEEWDEGFYDCTFGTCLQGHRRLLDD